MGTLGPTEDLAGLPVPADSGRGNLTFASTFQLNVSARQELTVRPRYSLTKLPIHCEMGKAEMEWHRRVVGLCTPLSPN
jgi:hypothetical protein